MANEGCVTGDGRQQFAFKYLYVKYILFCTVSHPIKGILKNKALFYEMKCD
jgi:hypothetical protein